MSSSADRSEPASARRPGDERCHLIAAVASDVIRDRDLTRDSIAWNDALASRFGHGIVASTTDWWLAQIHPDDRMRVCEAIEHARNADASEWSVDYRFRRADQTYARVSERGRILRDAQGIAVSQIAAMVDRSEQDELVALLSNELRAQLTSILGWTQMLRSTELAPALRAEAVETIALNAHAQSRLLDDWSARTR